MESSRIKLAKQEESFYSKLFELAGPDITGNISGTTGAQFLSTSGLSRDILHKIWTIADNLQQGKLDREAFKVACRLVSHCQSGLQPDINLVQREPALLPVFEGIQRTSNNNSGVDVTGKKEWDVISISDIGNDNMNTISDAVRAANIATSLTKLGINPLEFVPFQSGPELPKTSSIDWKIPEVDRQKYIRLFDSLDKNSQGFVDGSSARKLLEKSKLNKHVLGSLWELVDTDRDGALSRGEFINAMHLATCCKRGALLPNELPLELGSSGPNVENPAQVQHHNIPSSLGLFPKADNPAWKYSRTYLGGVEEVEETGEEIRHVHELCSQIESDISRMKIEQDKRRLLLKELEAEKRLLTESKTQVVDSRRKLNFDKLSLQRDRSKLTSEIMHLQKLIKEGTQDNQLLAQSISENQKEIERILTQVATFGSQRKEAVRQHNEELDKIETEQRETSGLLESFSRSNREVDVRVESERLMREKQRLIDEMQSPPADIPESVSSFSNEKSNKWAARILSESKGSSDAQNKKIGFGNAFFAGP